MPQRPSEGTQGELIQLRANHFQIRIPKIIINHYEVQIQPDKCPRRVNREIVENMVANHRIFTGQKPVFDGKKHLYTRDPLSIGRDKVSVFKGISNLVT